MLLINVKVIEGVISDREKRDLIERLTDAMTSVECENVRAVTWCVFEEIRSEDPEITDPMKSQAVRPFFGDRTGRGNGTSLLALWLEAR